MEQSSLEQRARLYGQGDYATQAGYLTYLGSPTFATCKQALKVVFSVKTTLMSIGCNIPRNAMPFDTLNHGTGLLTIR